MLDSHGINDNAKDAVPLKKKIAERHTEKSEENGIPIEKKEPEKRE